MTLQDTPGVGPTAGATLVDVCIATRRRPAMLRALLTSLLQQELPPGLSLRAIVVDNDAERSSEPVVEELRALGLEIEYAVEPQRNVSLARNRGVTMTSPAAEFLATIDDDAVASPHWLATLVSAARHYEAHVVLGAVHRVLPPDAPAHLVDSGAYQLYNPPTGSTEWLVYNTANALLRREVALRRPGPFRPDYGLTGGEDTELFHFLKQGGCRIVWSREAQVNETMPPERLRLRWLLPRSFREGVTYYKVFRRWTLSAATPFPWRWFSFTWWCSRKIVKLVALTAAGVASPPAKARAVAESKDLAFNLGIAARTAGLRYEPKHR
jgi:succinoglycan biosynthesis protein ExoM